ncbi:hypothetical protein [Sphingopyxis alaskensis]|uniref:hypothetical protein n=1 Tax=Sphingopyxis alaskensis TaxID=117207 RepID=UPI00391A034B
MTLTPSIFGGLLTGLFLAVLAFSQAAASIGLVFESFRPLGGSFFSWRAGQTRAAVALVARESQVNSDSAARIGRAVLVHAPLSPRSLWLIGKSMEVKGQKDRARRVMQQAERISRRDGAVQLWLATDRLQERDIAAGLRHYDLLIRGGGEAADAVIPRMAMIIMAPEGRRQLAPYIRENNPWLFRLLAAAVNDLPRALPVAQLLLDRGRNAPDIPNIEQVYAPLMSRLLNEAAYTEALRLYPLLPGANPRSLRDVSGTLNGRIDTGYPPFIWSFPEGNNQGGEFVSVDTGETGLDIFGAPGTVGVAATKIIAPAPGEAFFWKIVDRSGNLDGRVNWIATCLVGASRNQRVQSANLLGSSMPENRLMKMSLPTKCDLMRIDALVAGGIGRDPVNLVVGGLKLAQESRAK